MNHHRWGRSVLLACAGLLLTLPAMTRETGSAAASHGEEDRKPSSSRKSVKPRVKASMAFPTGDRRTSALLLEKTGPAEVAVDQSFEYEVQVTNLSKTTLKNVTVTDALVGMDVESSLPTWSARTEEEITWSVGEMKPGAVEVVRVTARSSRRGSALYTSTVAYDQSLSLVTKVVQPELSVTLVAPQTLSIWEPLVLTYQVHNSGNGPARRARIIQDLPHGLQSEFGSAAVLLEAGDIPAGKTREFRAELKMLRAGNYSGLARVEWDGGQADSDAWKTQVQAPVLQVEREADRRALTERATQYTITVRNEGDVAAPAVVLQEELPYGSAIVDLDADAKVVDNTVTWKLGTVAVGAEVKVSYSMRSLRAGDHDGTVTVHCPGLSPVSVETRTQVTGISAILVEVIDTHDPVPLDGTTTYVITATNQGSAPDKNLKVLCFWENAWSHVSSGGATESIVGDQTVSFRPLETLQPGERAIWKIELKGVRDGDTRFKVSVTSDGHKRPIKESESTVLYR